MSRSLVRPEMRRAEPEPERDIVDALPIGRLECGSPLNLRAYSGSLSRFYDQIHFNRPTRGST
jgi:hypothetical protein